MYVRIRGCFKKLFGDGEELFVQENGTKQMNKIRFKETGSQLKRHDV